jgi:hypothetical protein
VARVVVVPESELSSDACGLEAASGCERANVPGLLTKSWTTGADLDGWPSVSPKIPVQIRRQGDDAVIIFINVLLDNKVYIT